MKLELIENYNFTNHLKQHGISLERSKLTTLQINLGKLCNQACHHCHVNAGPKRTEQMTQETAVCVIELLANSPTIETLDITGGAPEMNANFKYLVQKAHKLNIHVMDRCNLTILLEKGYETLPKFLAENQVEIVASLPCYLSDNVDKQRGRGVFDKSIIALQKLNNIGYGKPDTGLLLNLVYNPIGGVLPPPQSELESKYKEQLYDRFKIEFNQLYTITNMPISRFKQQLKRNDQLDSYLSLLLESFNPSTVKDVMCRNLISVDWQGELFDCDFNQMLEMSVPSRQKTIWDLDSIDAYIEKSITLGSHCFGCVAGSGSSCGGALT